MAISFKIDWAKDGNFTGSPGFYRGTWETSQVTPGDAGVYYRGGGGGDPGGVVTPGEILSATAWVRSSSTRIIKFGMEIKNISEVIIAGGNTQFPVTANTWTFVTNSNITAPAGAAMAVLTFYSDSDLWTAGSTEDIAGMTLTSTVNLINRLTAPWGTNLSYFNGYSQGASIAFSTSSAGGPPIPYDDVSARVRPRVNVVTCQYGRDQSTALAPISAGSGMFTLDNRSRDYTPRNISSPLYGKVRPSRPVYISRTVGGNTYTIFRGHTDDNPINPNLDDKTVTIGLIDNLADLRGQSVSTGVYQSIRTGDAIHVILDSWGWPADLRDIDPGATVIPFWWEDNQDALSAIEKLVQSEGAPALVTLSPNGSITFRDRHHRLTHTRSINSQATFRALESATDAYLGVPFVYDEAWRNIVNQVITNVDVRGLQPLADVWTSDLRISLGAGEEQLITATSSDPFVNAITPVLDTDYTLISGSVSMVLFRDSGLATTIKLTAGGSGAVIEALKLRAQPVGVITTLQVKAEDVGSVAEYGPRSLPFEIPWCDPQTAEAVLGAAVATRSQPLPIITATFAVPKTRPDIANMVLGLDLSDRVTVYEDQTALSGTDFYIEHIAHEFTDELDHRVTFGLELCPTSNISPVFRFDTSGAGFNDGKFGSGIDDYTATFQFDNNNSGHRFDEGRFVN